MTSLLISCLLGAMIFGLGVIYGAFLMRKSAEFGNKLTLMAKDDIPVAEEIIPVDQEYTE